MATEQVGVQFMQLSDRNPPPPTAVSEFDTFKRSMCSMLIFAELREYRYAQQMCSIH